MPSKRRAAPVSSASRKRKSARRKTENIEDEIPEIFQEMLAEAAASSSSAPPPQAYIGRWKASAELQDDFSDRESISTPKNAPSSPSPTQTRGLQIVYDDFEDSEDEDVEFEDVDLIASDLAKEEPGPVNLQLNLSAPLATPKRNVRRKLASGGERRLRRDVHKAHLLLLLSALQHRNHWCENEQVQAILKPLVPRKTIALLHVDDSEPQAERSRSFLKGIEGICALWRSVWTMTARGMRRAHYRDDIDIEKELDELEDSIDFDDFKSAAHSRRGSRDIGAQLFCSLLRSLAIDTRLVSSLQVLPFSAVAKGQTPEKPTPNYTNAPTQDFGTSPSTFSQRRFAESPYPVYWVEVFSPSTATWMSLDPLVRNTINKPRTAFEPPFSDTLNSMLYVIAFEDDGAAKDVTLRYTAHFNAKTRKTRIEHTRGGDVWFSRVMGYFEKPLPEVRDELEDAEFVRRAAQEGMPKNVADFKGHPVYVLERHLRRNELLHPRREVGKVTVGAGSSKKLESVFRRKDAHVCRTNDAWYRRGRDVRQGMEPLKYVAPRTRLEREEVGYEDEEIESAGMALYAEFQTELYIPPPVVNARIPRNKFGNLDVYVETMIPAGAIHVRHPLAAKAAQVLGINFADAVTGFEFKGRQGTAVVDGVVVSEDQRVAMVAVIVGLQSQVSEEVQSERTKIALAVWRKWLRALQIRDRLEQEYGGKEDGDQMQLDEADDEEDETYRDDDDAGGGFMPDPNNENAGSSALAPAPYDPALGKAMTLPPLPQIPEYHEITVIESPHRPLKPKPADPTKPDTHTAVKTPREAGGFVLNEQQEPLIDQPEIRADYAGGGFLIDDEDSGGGGFVPDDQDADDADDVIESTISPTQHHQPLVKTDNVVVPDFHKALFAAAIEPQEQPPEQQRTPNDSATQLPMPQNRELSTPPGKSSNIDDAKSDNPEQEPNKDNVQDEEDSKTSPVDSATSMLSHDPDEDEAEPEWLLDSLS